MKIMIPVQRIESTTTNRAPKHISVALHLTRTPEWTDETYISLAIAKEEDSPFDGSSDSFGFVCLPLEQLRAAIDAIGTSEPSRIVVGTSTKGMVGSGG